MGELPTIILSPMRAVGSVIKGPYLGFSFSLSYPLRYLLMTALQSQPIPHSSLVIGKCLAMEACVLGCVGRLDISAIFQFNENPQ